jgi:hypothetical protein
MEECKCLTKKYKRAIMPLVKDKWETFRFMVRNYNNYEVDTKTGCWIWQFRDKPALRSYHKAPAKAFYEHFIGPVPKGNDLMHICDNPLCVNPSHLRVGSHAENMYDMSAQGQRAKGGTIIHPWKFRALKKRDEIIRTLQSCAGV